MKKKDLDKKEAARRFRIPAGWGKMLMPAFFLLPWFVTALSRRMAENAVHRFSDAFYWGIPLLLFGKRESGWVQDPHLLLHTFLLWGMSGLLLGILYDFAVRAYDRQEALFSKLESEESSNIDD